MNLRNVINGHADLGSRLMPTEPTIPHGYRLVSGPHTAAEIEEGWTICAEWTHWDARPEVRHEAGNVRAMRGGRMKTMCYLDDPDRDIYRIEKVTA